MKKVSKLLATMLALVMSATMFTACVTPDYPDIIGEDEDVDINRVQLYVYSYDGGYGNEWLAAAKKRYEELHKNDTQWEEGKTGVQIMLTLNKDMITNVIAGLPTDQNEVFFHEGTSYYQYVNDDLLADITEVYEGDLGPYGDAAGTTVKDKLVKEQLDFYGVEESDGKTHYYGMPYYSGHTGFVYNVDLFDERGYYFRRNPEPDANGDDLFIGGENSPYRDDERSLGPDGKTGIIEGVDYSLDDGLPATYDEFYKLCDYMAGEGTYPLIWSGKYYANYMKWLSWELVADYEGYDQMTLTYTLDGRQAEHVGTVDNEGVFHRDAVQPVIDETNGYELARSEGIYHSIDFIRHLVTTPAWTAPGCFNNAYSHEEVQSYFLWSGHSQDYQDPIAMLYDGIWWDEEAREVFNTMAVRVGEEYSRKNRRFGFLPFPKANAEASKESTLLDFHRSLCFVRKTVDQKKMPLIIDFLKFLHTDESLKEFTSIVNAPLSYNYTMTEDDMKDMTNFGKSILNLRNKSKVVYPFGSNSVYVNNEGLMMGICDAEFGSTVAQEIAQYLHEHQNVTAKEFFDGVYNYRKSRINWKPAT